MQCILSVCWLIMLCTVTVVIFHLCKLSYRHKNRFGDLWLCTVSVSLCWCVSLNRRVFHRDGSNRVPELAIYCAHASDYILVLRHIFTSKHNWTVDNEKWFTPKHWIIRKWTSCEVFIIQCLIIDPTELFALIHLIRFPNHGSSCMNRFTLKKQTK